MQPHSLQVQWFFVEVIFNSGDGIPLKGGLVKSGAEGVLGEDLSFLDIFQPSFTPYAPFKTTAEDG